MWPTAETAADEGGSNHHRTPLTLHVSASLQPACTLNVHPTHICDYLVASSCRVAFMYMQREHIVASSTLTFVRAIVVVRNDFSGHPHAVQLWGRSHQFNSMRFESVVRE